MAVAEKSHRKSGADSTPSRIDPNYVPEHGGHPHLFSFLPPAPAACLPFLLALGVVVRRHLAEPLLIFDRRDE